MPITMDMRKRLFSIAFQFPIVLLLISNSLSQGTNQWSTPEPVACYAGIKASVRNMGYSKEAGGYRWGIRLTNTYDVPVKFSYKLTIGEENKSTMGFQPTRVLKAGEVWTDGADLVTAKLFNSPSNEYFVYVEKVCFDGMQCGGVNECYASCDRVPGKPNQSCGVSGSASAAVKDAVPGAGKENPFSDSNSTFSGKWKSSYNNMIVDVEMAQDGLTWKKADGKSFKFTETSPDAFRFESGSDVFILKVVNNNRMSYWESGALAGYYDRVQTTPAVNGPTSNEKTGFSVEGDWVGENVNSIKVKTALADDGRVLQVIRLVGSSRPVSYYYKVSSDSYQQKSKDYETTKASATIKFLNDGRFVITFEREGKQVGDLLYYRRMGVASPITEGDVASKITNFAGDWVEERNNALSTRTILSNDGQSLILKYGKIEENAVRLTRVSEDSFVGKKNGFDYTIKFSSNDRFLETGVNDELIYNWTFYWRRVGSTTPTSQTKPTVDYTPGNVAGIWDGDNGITGTISMKQDGFNWTNQGAGFPAFFKKLSADTYRFDDGPNFCIVKFSSFDKLAYGCNGSHIANFTRRK